MHSRQRIVFFLMTLLINGRVSAQDITGLWRGTLYNDTTQLYLPYEIAISETGKGKLTGYSHTWFIVNDEKFYGVKKVRIRKVKDGKIIIEDEELIANNYPVEPPKGVHQISALTLDISGATMTLSGLFTTTRTREYHPLTGTVHVEHKNEYGQSAIIPHLQELGLGDQLTFLGTSLSPLASIVIEEKPVNNQHQVNDTLHHPVIVAVKIPVRLPVVISPEPKKEVAVITPPVVKKENSIKPVIIRKDPIVVNVNKETKPVQTEIKPVHPKEPIQADPVIKKDPILVKKEENNLPVQAAVDIASRKIEKVQELNFHTDSLVLTLYDNGEVDGDTVSVLMNGTVIMPNVGLSTKAVRKTIYISPAMDSVQLIMYAETLGTIPPNTGLLIVYDGEERHEIFFTGDLQRSAAIVFRRKK